MRLRASLVTAFIVVASAIGCGRADATASASAGSSTTAATPPVAQIVFIDQEESCECTKKRTDATWKELHNAVGNSRGIEVVRVHLDTQPELAKAYLESKPLMVPPGLYFMSAQGDLVGMLQGELSSAQISAVLVEK